MSYLVLVEVRYLSGDRLEDSDGFLNSLFVHDNFLTNDFLSPACGCISPAAVISSPSPSIMVHGTSLGSTADASKVFDKDEHAIIIPHHNFLLLDRHQPGHGDRHHLVLPLNPYIRHHDSLLHHLDFGNLDFFHLHRVAQLTVMLAGCDPQHVRLVDLKSTPHGLSNLFQQLNRLRSDRQVHHPTQLRGTPRIPITHATGCHNLLSTVGIAACHLGIQAFRLC